MSQRVEQRINELHTQLRITAAEQPQWDQFAAVMRDNARDMDGLLEQRGQQFASMNALQDMQSYEQLAEKHAEHLQKLTAAFETLYNQLPANQKQMADQVFRAQAQQREQHAMQSGHSR
ncbi:MAG TPA: Spy/CpxP family protein refolding chaperone [Stellaceae bacterium]|nr:Spy/CpxP family protein refolding chaperone [Stellaceae bacterium]